MADTLSYTRTHASTALAHVSGMGKVFKVEICFHLVTAAVGFSTSQTWVRRTSLAINAINILVHMLFLHVRVECFPARQQSG